MRWVVEGYGCDAVTMAKMWLRKVLALRLEDGMVLRVRIVESEACFGEEGTAVLIQG